MSTDDRDELEPLLRQLDHPPPAVDARTLIARAQQRPVEVRWLRWAAGVILALALAGVAYAAPGSPLRRWIHEWISPQPQAPRPGPTSPDLRASGIAVAPGTNLLILFTTAQEAGSARVTLTDGSQVVVRAPVDAATYTTGADRLEISTRSDSADFEIEIPRTAPRVEIRVVGRPRYLKEGATVTGSAAVPLTP